MAAWWAACLLWSGSFASIRIGLADVGPFTFAAARLAIALTIFVPIVLARGMLRSVNARQLATIAGSGVLLLGVNYGLVYWGAQHVPSGLVAILLAATPVTGLLLGALLGTEVITASKVAAVLMGLLGVIGIVGTEARVSGPNGLTGALALALSTVCVAAAYVWAKRTTTGVSPVVLAAVQSAAGFAALSGMALTMEGNPLDASWSASSVAALLYLGVGASVIAFSLNYWVLARMDPSSMLMMGVAEVPVAVGLGHLVLAERLPPGTYLGAACIVTGLLLGPLRRPSRPSDGRDR